MKILLLFPNFYSFGDALSTFLQNAGAKVNLVDIQDLIPKNINTLYTKTTGLPNRFKKPVVKNYYSSINKLYTELLSKHDYDLVIIYNNQFLHPEIVKSFKDKTKFIFLLGDNPLYSHTYEYNLTLLEYASAIVSPDSFWISQLQMLGLKNFMHDVFGFNPSASYVIDEFAPRNKSDLLFVGGNYPGAAGYKRTKFLAQFSKFDLKVYGTGKAWTKWVKHFPDLSSKINKVPKRISSDEMNQLMNSSKIYPIENNPGLFYGMHFRFWESIGSGIFPLAEYAPDIESFFPDINIPLIRNYHEIPELTVHLLKNNSERDTIMKKLQNRLHSHFLPEHFIKRLFKNLEINFQ